jgi:hypothetical protein
MMIEHFKNMIGRTMVSCSGCETNSDQMTFVSTDGCRFSFQHHQDCCESVSIYDVIGDTGDILDSPMLGAEEISSEDEPEADVGGESYTWTFYRFWTAKGTVTVRWLGTSNGYYSEGVDYSETRADI